VIVKGDVLLLNFYSRMADDARISSTHISLYLALLMKWETMAGMMPFKVKREEIMGMAKINSRQTYNKRMKELHSYHYIIYSPSADSNAGSWVSMEVE
jgi:hypothetical protein